MRISDWSSDVCSSDLKQVPRMLADPMSPLGIRWSYALKAAPWFLRFLEASRASRVEEISKHLWALSRDAMAAHRRLIELSKAHDIVRPNGGLKVYSSRQRFERNAGERTVRARTGVGWGQGW